MKEAVKEGAAIALYGIGGGIAMAMLSALIFAFCAGIGWQVSLDASMIAAGGLGWSQFFRLKKG